MATGDIAPRMSPHTRKGVAGQIAYYGHNGTIVQGFSSQKALPYFNGSSILSALTGTNAGVYFDGTGNVTAGTLPNNTLGSSVVTATSGGSPIFSAAISAQSLNFTISNAAAGALLGNWSNASAAPTYVAGTATGQVPVRQADGSVAWQAQSGSGTVNSGTVGQMAWYAGTGTAVSGNANITASSGALTLGVNGSAAGSLILKGATSGSATISVPSVAGSVTMSIPAANCNPVQPQGSATANKWVQYIDSSGVQTLVQPDFSNLSGTASVAQGGTGRTTVTANSVVTGNSGGTAQSAVTGTNQALYFNGSSVPTAGTLPPAAGGTGATSLTGNSIITANSGGTAQAAITGTNAAAYFNASGAPTAGVLPQLAGGSGVSGVVGLGYYSLVGGL